MLYSSGFEECEPFFTRLFSLAGLRFPDMASFEFGFVQKGDFIDDVWSQKKKLTSVSTKTVYCITVSRAKRTDIRGSLKQLLSSLNTYFPVQIHFLSGCTHCFSTMQIRYWWLKPKNSWVGWVLAGLIGIFLFAYVLFFFIVALQLVACGTVTTRCQAWKAVLRSLQRFGLWGMS